MKTIIAGGRDLTDEVLMNDVIKSSDFTISEVVCGMAQGIVLMAKAWAIESGIAITEFPGDWKRFGKAAGPIRN